MHATELLTNLIFKCMQNKNEKNLCEKSRKLLVDFGNTSKFYLIWATMLNDLFQVVASHFAQHKWNECLCQWMGVQ